MALGSTIAAYNILNSRNNSLTSPLSEKSITGKSALRRTCEKTTKNPTFTSTNKQTANQAFYDTLSKIFPDN